MKNSIKLSAIMSILLTTEAVNLKANSYNFQKMKLDHNTSEAQDKMTGLEDIIGESIGSASLAVP